MVTMGIAISMHNIAWGLGNNHSVRNISRLQKVRKTVEIKVLN